MFVTDVMTPTVATVDVDTPVREAAALMRTFDIGFLPVTHEGICAGAITDRDLALRIVADGLDPDATAVGMILPHDVGRETGRGPLGNIAVASVSQDASVEEALHRMEELGVHRLAVFNDEIAIVGIVSMTDLQRHTLVETA
jgi:CBS domain-containing protein